MAVYKPSYLYPNTQTLNLSIVPGDSPLYLKCMINSSNKRVVGYSVRIYDARGNQIYPSGEGALPISPITDLSGWDGGHYTQHDDPDHTNSGLNGTPLFIPFFVDKNSANKPNQLKSQLDGVADYYEELSDEPLASGISRIHKDGSTWYKQQLVKQNDGSVAWGDSQNITGQYYYIRKGSKAGQTIQASGDGSWASEWDMIGTSAFDIYKFYPGQMYSWQITLYQGPEPGTAAWDQALTVDGLLDINKLIKAAPESFDKLVTSGTVLGTSATRWQLGRPGLTGGYTIPDTNVVLLNKWAQIGVVNANGEPLGESSAIGSRINIKAYDQTMGHIYVAEGEFQKGYMTSLFKTQGHIGVQIYKHANSDEYILKTDGTADFATTVNQKLDSLILPIDKQNDDGTTTTATPLSIKEWSGQTVSPTFTGGTDDGTRLLVMGQSVPEQNGVYVLHANAKPTRAGDFDSWADFLGGKLVYVKRGYYGHRNFVASASVNGTLWVYNNAVTGNGDLGSGTPIYFNDEHPVVLFSGLANDEATYAGVITQEITDKEVSDTNLVYVFYGGSLHSEGINAAVGETLVAAFTQNGNSYTFKKYRASVVTDSDNKSKLVWKVDKIIDDSSTIRIAGGFYGERAVKIKTSGALSDKVPFEDDYRVYTAELLGNGASRLMISPYKRLAYPSLLKFDPSNKHAPKQDVFIDGSSIKLNRTWWSLEANSSNGIGTIDDKRDGDSISAERDTVTDTPYTYKIYTDNAESDEAAFSVYHLPYLTLTEDSDHDYYVAVTRYIPFAVIDSSKTDTVDYHYLGVDDDNKTFLVKDISEAYYESSGHAAFFRAKYHQPENASWVSYRWILKNSNGEVVQDTGKQHDKDMGVLFLGLESYREKSGPDGTTVSGDAIQFAKHVQQDSGKFDYTHQNEYTALLSVEDNLGYILIYPLSLVCLTTKAAQPVQWATQFKAGLDCQTMSVLITVPTSIIEEDLIKHNFPDHNSSNRPMYSLYRREYAAVTKMGTGTTNWHGEWQLVKYHATESTIRDFNIEAGKSYQYAIIWENSAYGMVFANADNIDTSMDFGNPVKVEWDWWSLLPLTPVMPEPYGAPIIKHAYIANPEDIWIFKLGLESGSRSQNISQTEIDTAGQYPRYATGEQNSLSGSLSVYAGDVYYGSELGYHEHLLAASIRPQGSSDEDAVIREWRKMIASGAPKLLRDSKGEAWIVQTTGSSESYNEFIIGRPRKLSFDWKQIADVSFTSITGAGYDINNQIWWDRKRNRH